MIKKESRVLVIATLATIMLIGLAVTHLPLRSVRSESLHPDRTFQTQ